MFIHEYYAYSTTLDKLVLLQDASPLAAEERVTTMNLAQELKAEDWTVITRVNQVA